MRAHRPGKYQLIDINVIGRVRTKKFMVSDIMVQEWLDESRVETTRVYVAHWHVDKD